MSAAAVECTDPGGEEADLEVRTGIVWALVVECDRMSMLCTCIAHS